MMDELKKIKYMMSEETYQKKIKQAKQKERDKIKNMMFKEQFFGSRGYDEGCIKGYEKVMEYLKKHEVD